MVLRPLSEVPQSSPVSITVPTVEFSVWFNGTGKNIQRSAGISDLQLKIDASRD